MLRALEMRTSLRPPLALLYHGVGELPRRHDPRRMMLSPRRFRRHLRSLAKRGYEFVTVSEFADRLSDGLSGDRLSDGASTGALCALTFDDGLRDNLEVLPSALAEFGARATVFVSSGMLGRPHPGFHPEAGVRLMSAAELRRLANLDGIEIGSHTRHHTDLGGAGAREAYEEMVASKRELEELLQRPVSSFAYPYGRYSRVCPGAAKRAGYKVAVACAPYGDWHRYELYRQSADPRGGSLVFALKSRGLWQPLRASAPGRLAHTVVRRTLLR
jgi:peptidoglycan/xylan/chitin deacetylase (PgdA/CDA1 family)